MHHILSYLVHCVFRGIKVKYLFCHLLADMSYYLCFSLKATGAVLDLSTVCQQWSPERVSSQLSTQTCQRNKWSAASWTPQSATATKDLAQCTDVQLLLLLFFGHIIHYHSSKTQQHNSCAENDQLSRLSTIKTKVFKLIPWLWENM